MRYHDNAEKAVYYNTDPITGDPLPSMTDQSGADETNINVIVKRYAVSGQAPGAPVPGQFGDFQHLPDNLRDAIVMARSATALKDSLPPQLKNKSIEELLELTPDELTNILTPPAPKPDDKKDEPK